MDDTAYKALNLLIKYVELKGGYKNLDKGTKSFIDEVYNWNIIDHEGYEDLYNYVCELVKGNYAN